MSTKLILALCGALVILSGCAELQRLTNTTSDNGGPDHLKAVAAGADALYVNAEAPAGGTDFRNVYIAPANLANMQVIQPEGAAADGEWWVTDEEASIIQRAVAEEFSAALLYHSAYYIVDTPAQAEIIVNTAVVAVHPNQARSAVAKGGKPDGALTVSIALVDAANGVVLVRAVDTRSSDNIWAFNQVENDDPAINLIFRALGSSIRGGLLQLQGRPADPVPPPLPLQEQK